VKGQAKRFFFEKKNQKTFSSGVAQTLQNPALGAAANRQKFFGSFFQKRTLGFTLDCPAQ